jgi:glycosyltransferase involved in cell wall biosynthesis
MGTEDMLASDTGGFLVPDDLEVFVSRVAVLLRDEGLRRAKAAEARAAANKWTIDATTDRLLAVYQQALEARAKRNARRDRRASCRAGSARP